MTPSQNLTLLSLNSQTPPSPPASSPSAIPLLPTPSPSGTTPTPSHLIRSKSLIAGTGSLSITSSGQLLLCRTSSGPNPWPNSSLATGSANTTSLPQSVFRRSNPTIGALKRDNCLGSLIQFHCPQEEKKTQLLQNGGRLIVAANLSLQTAFSSFSDPQSNSIPLISLQLHRFFNALKVFDKLLQLKTGYLK